MSLGFLDHMRVVPDHRIPGMVKTAAVLDGLDVAPIRPQAPKRSRAGIGGADQHVHVRGLHCA